MVILKEQRWANVESLWGRATLKRRWFCCVITDLMTPPQSCCHRKVLRLHRSTRCSHSLFYPIHNERRLLVALGGSQSLGGGFPQAGRSCVYTWPSSEWVRRRPQRWEQTEHSQSRSFLNNASVPSNENNRGTFYNLRNILVEKNVSFQNCFWKILWTPQCTVGGQNFQTSNKQTW